MSGKGKQPRVKGNLKPTTSIDQIDGRLASQIKRLGKNDSTTKMRALFELKSYVSEHTWETGLEGMMLAWPPLFKRHIFDTDRRVRVAVAGVHAALVKRCGKRLAPNLKQVIGAWVGSYFDPHRDVGKASRLAFEVVFPESKRTEAYAYCTRDIVEFAVDNIVNQTAESLSDARFADAEEMRSKYEHVVGASFGALALVIEEVPTARLAEEQALFNDVLGNKKAMGFVGDRSSTFIRRSVYRLIRIVMLTNPALVSDTYEIIGQALLSSSFLEADPNAHGDMWDAVLLLTKNYPQAWAVDVGKKKKGLFEFLSSGKCRLAPTISYPSILALLANLPASIVDDSMFQSGFGDALWKGASATAAAEPGSRAYHQENVGLVRAMCECFSFLWTRTLKSSSSLDASVVAVGKEAAKEVDRLWHFYLQHSESYEEMAESIVKLYTKIDSLSVKYAGAASGALFEKVWTHASWFALQRVADAGSTHAVVYLITQMMEASSTALLADSARRLLSGFCLVAEQAPESAVASRLIQALTQLAGGVVFQEGFASKFSRRLEGVGSQQEAIGLVVSRAQFLAESEGSVAGAAQSIDAFIEASLGSEAGLSVVAGLLAALADSELAQTRADWKRDARLPLLEKALVTRLAPASAPPSPPPVALIRVYGQALQGVFGGSSLVSAGAAQAVFAWTCDVFTQHRKEDDWALAVREVISVWITLARDSACSRRLIELWLGQAASLALLFDVAMAEGGGEGDVSRQARRCWAAVEAQAVGHGLAQQLAQALSGAIMARITYTQDPAHLARLAHAVYERICPEGHRAQLASEWTHIASSEEPGLARRAVFIAEFVRLAQLDFGDADEEVVADLVVCLAFVLTRDTLNGADAQAVQQVAAGLVSTADDGWLATLAQYVTGCGSGDGVWARVVAKCVERSEAPERVLVLRAVTEWVQWTRPLTAADIEATLADRLACHLEEEEETPHAATLAAVCRAVRLRHCCARAPAMRSALLSAIGHASALVDSPVRLASMLELVAELVPADSRATLDAVTSAKIVRLVLAVPTTAAALAVLERLAECMAPIDEGSSVALARLCLRCVASAEGDDGVLAAAARSVAALAPATTSHGAVGPIMRQLAEQILDACVVSDRPLPDGVRALSALVRCDHVTVPRFDRLYPVLVAADPRLGLELLRLILSASDLAAYMAPHAEALAALIATTAKALADLGVPLDELPDAVEADEYVRCSALRLLLALALAAHCADSMAQDKANQTHNDCLPDAITHRRAFDLALPLVCALLGLRNNPAAATTHFNPKLWDLSSGLHWISWADELAQNPTGDQLFPLLAFHLLHRLAWSFPATLRSWWAGLEQASRGTSIAVETFMAKHVCPSIIEQEVGRIRAQVNSKEKEPTPEISDDDSDHWIPQSLPSPPNAITRVLEEYDGSTVRPAASQVTLTFTVDDSTLEILVKIPPSYPLTLPTFESLRRVGVPENRWRCWLVAAQTQMARNSHLDSACAQLLANIGAHFDGVEDCAICYSAVGVLDNSLPTKQCRTCKNKFHRMCLFKWFNTSNQSTCPLCRNLF
ncbi:hypothetical protein GGI20_004982 [Coemansia sp. BCRC 34301]|nr:hypothetical protein GGI20_004982 [Coemansia sp. BCRC 34301]